MALSETNCCILKIISFYPECQNSSIVASVSGEWSCSAISHPLKTNVKRSAFVSLSQSFNCVTPWKHCGHALWIRNRRAYRKMCLAKMNYVCTSCSLRDSLVSVSGMLWKRPLNVADPACMFCLRVRHFATMGRMSAGQSLTRLPPSPRTSCDPWRGGVNSVCVPPSGPRQSGWLTSVVAANHQREIRRDLV